MPGTNEPWWWTSLVSGGQPWDWWERGAEARQDTEEHDQPPRRGFLARTLYCAFTPLFSALDDSSWGHAQQLMSGGDSWGDSLVPPSHKL